MGSWRELDEGWVLRAVNPPAGLELPDRIRASVPGCVHTDLLAAGLIADPHQDENERQLDWVGHCDWEYQTTFDWDSAADAGPGAVTDLVCAGLDTVTTITLNGAAVGRTANMHRKYRFDVSEPLRSAQNTLTVRFDSPYRYAENLRDQLGTRPNSYPQPFNFIRKMAANFGWDWGPAVVTAGIWQGISLHRWHRARLGEVRPLVSVDRDSGQVRMHVTIQRATDEPLRLLASVGEHEAVTEVGAGVTECTVTVTVPEPRLWWPHGYGEPHRYPASITLATADGSTLDTWQRRVGFRTVCLDTTPDDAGSRYALVVNGQPVFIRGVNWIPDDSLVSRVGPARYAGRLRQARDVNANYVRVWGGGIYESDHFYDACDELGLMAGQDFAFACAAYPEEEPLRSEIAAEAAYQVGRLAHHPSLVLWTGNNENIWGYADWGWADQLDGRTWGAGYYYDLLPSIVAELDPTRPYWPGSPYSGSPSIHPNDPARGSTHLWEVWNRDDYLRYRDYRPRFVGEFGYQGPATYATLRAAISAGPLTANSPGIRARQKAENGMAKLARGLQQHFGLAENDHDWLFFTQIIQARAFSVGIEHFRSLRPYCMGAIVWQLNDDWPSISWSLVDSGGRPKPAWYAVRHSYASRLLTIQPADTGLELVAVNETPSIWEGQADVARHALDGTSLATYLVAVTVPPRSAVRIPLPGEVAVPGDARAEVVRARLTSPGDGAEARTAGTAWWFFAEDKEICYPAAQFDVTADGTKLTVTAGTILRDLCVFADRLDAAATVDDALITLLPGESHTFTVTGVADLTRAAQAPVLRCINDRLHVS